MVSVPVSASVPVSLKSSSKIIVGSLVLPASQKEKQTNKCSNNLFQYNKLSCIFFYLEMDKEKKVDPLDDYADSDPEEIPKEQADKLLEDEGSMETDQQPGSMEPPAAPPAGPPAVTPAEPPVNTE
jgi:hypothetical protein